MPLDRTDVEIDYTNWRGERRMRRIRPLNFFHGATDWHTTPCWQVYAQDLETQELRYFAMQSVHSWRELSHA
jgi:predicted DNA-binding transcriptional regulator YafY